MLRELTKLLYYFIRENSDVTIDALATALKKNRQIVYRWEKDGQIPTDEDERILLELAKCTRLRFAEYMCKALTAFLGGRRVMIAPEGVTHYLPMAPLAKAAQLFQIYHDRLDHGQRNRIREKLSYGKSLDATSEHICCYLAQEIEHEIAEAMATKGEKFELPWP